jgi:hypothetical protein
MYLPNSKLLGTSPTNTTYVCDYYNMGLFKGEQKYFFPSHSRLSDSNETNRWCFKKGKRTKLQRNCDETGNPNEP